MTSDVIHTIEVPAEGRGLVNLDQYKYLLNPLKKSRIASRSVQGKQLSYLEAWDVKAHLTRIFGFGNWDLRMLDYHHVGTREYKSQQDKPMIEVVYAVRMELAVRDNKGREICRHAEAAVGSNSGPDYLLGDTHDNALKTAASDATKRCAINLGTQFGLSLYDNGATSDVVKTTLVYPEGYEKPEVPAETQAALEKSLGAKPVEEKS